MIILTLDPLKKGIMKYAVGGGNGGGNITKEILLQEHFYRKMKDVLL